MASPLSGLRLALRLSTLHPIAVTPPGVDLLRQIKAEKSLKQRACARKTASAQRLTRVVCGAPTI